MPTVARIAVALGITSTLLGACSDDAGPAPVATGGTAGAAGSAGDAGSGGQATACTDECPFTGGIEWGCKRRFMYGINYAWHHFGGDFGGIPEWNQAGVASNSMIAPELADMSANGVSVVRWWVWPDFRGAGVSFDSSDTPTGLGTTTIADLNKALELAEANDLYLMLTLFSFDNFRPTKTEFDVRSEGLKPILLDADQRSALLEKAVRPFVRATAESPYSHRLIAWDVINEPEWAISGSSLYGGDEAFTPDDEVETLSHAEMESFIKDVVAVIRSESDALVSVGSAAMKWKHAWSQVDVDFHQFHTYDWVNPYWPYSKSPTEYGVAGKPVVMGEFPTVGLMAASYAQLVESWFSNGYAGAISWDYTDYKGKLAAVKAFADAHPCQTRF